MYRRRYRRRYRRYGRSFRYSNETYQNTGNFNSNGADPGAGVSPDNYDTNGFRRGNQIMIPAVNIVSASNNPGIRKVKNFTIQINPTSTVVAQDGTYNAPPDVRLLWALVYVPEGVATNELSTAIAGSLYEPNQNVIAQGVASPNQINRTFSSLARNLNSGDRIVFICYFLFPINIDNTTDDIVSRVFVTVNYAIAYS